MSRDVESSRLPNTPGNKYHSKHTQTNKYYSKHATTSKYYSKTLWQQKKIFSVLPFTFITCISSPHSHVLWWFVSDMVRPLKCTDSFFMFAFTWVVGGEQWHTQQKRDTVSLVIPFFLWQSWFIWTNHLATWQQFSAATTATRTL